MERQLLVTKDGSHTVAIKDSEITYHSRHGALQESIHVFIDTGLRYKTANSHDTLTVFEVGLGTGLNALLTCDEAVNTKRKINYIAVEPLPLDEEMAGALNYEDVPGSLEAIHKAEWNKPVAINPFFTITKFHAKLEDVLGGSDEYRVHADLVYFDAFSPEAQPELWTEDIFKGIARIMNPGAVLVTYCSKSVVRKTMVNAGLVVKKVPGPLGKREMVRAEK